MRLDQGGNLSQLASVASSTFTASSKVTTGQIHNSAAISILNGSAAQGLSVRHLFAAGTYNTTPGQGDVWATSDMRAPIFYDYDDTTYYLDPANTGTSLKVAGKIESTSAEVTYTNGVTQYTKSYSSLDTTGQAVAGLVSSSNGASAMLVFETGGGGEGGYQKVVYNCINSSGTWAVYKDIDEDQQHNIIHLKLL